MSYNYINPKTNRFILKDGPTWNLLVRKGIKPLRVKSNNSKSKSSSKKMSTINKDIKTKLKNLVIIGSGPAAYTSAIYTSRAEIPTVLFESASEPGGQLMTTTDVENFPGFPEGIQGPELMENMRNQCLRFGTTIIEETVVSCDLKNKSGPFKIITNTGRELECGAIIIATGATAKRLNFPGADEFWQKGVGVCAVCDGASPIFRNKPLIVIGGGDSAMEEAIFLTKFGSKVYIVHRRDELRASKTMQKRAMSNPKIEFLLSHTVTRVTGSQFVERAEILNLKSGEKQLLNVNGVFFAIGHEPNVKFLNNQLLLDSDNYIITKKTGSATGSATGTSIKGVFACGDVQDKHYRQAITAAGSGCMAAIDAEHYLSSL